VRAKTQRRRARVNAAAIPRRRQTGSTRTPAGPRSARPTSLWLGHTIDEALANLAEAVELYLEEVDDPAGHVTATPLVTSFQLPAA